MVRLSDLEVLVVDCQATAARPRGHLLELGWARVSAAATDTQARLIALPPRERVPPAVVRITGISEPMLEAGVEARDAWRELSEQASALAQRPAPTVVHFARFEQPFLCSLAAAFAEASAPGATCEFPLDIVCTHDIACRLLPGLPRRSLRALAGYFGRAVGTLRRSADHVEATAFVWRELVRLLEAEGIDSWGALRGWLAARRVSTTARRRIWPMPRATRLALPDAPGLYRMLRTSGDVLYVGKASSLRHRVNSYFRKQHGIHERTLEMLSQARNVSFEVTATALEAALLEPDEIKRHRPPYNVALTVEDRHVWFAPPDLSERSPRASPRCPVGPFPSAETLDQFTALARGSRESLGRGRWAPDAATFDAGYTRLRAAHGELSRGDLGAHSRVLRLGTRLWQEGRRDRDVDWDGAAATDRPTPVWTAEQVQIALEWLALRAALARRRARWLTRLVDATITWSEPGADDARLIVIENGDITLRESIDPGTLPPVPPGYDRSVAARHDAFTVACFDRLRVLTTEIKRLASEGAPVSLRLGVAPPLAGARLAYALSWV